MDHRSLIPCVLLLLSVIFVGIGESYPRDFSTSEIEIRTHDDASVYRLPREIVPISYDLRILTRLAVEDFAYDGEARIALRVIDRTDTVVVHAHGLNVRAERSVLYRGADNSSDTVAIQSQRYRPREQFYSVTLARHLEPGLYTLALFFTGEIRDDVFGFYRSSYHVGGSRKWIGITQFSPTHARRAFPCMDEPGLKAIFTIHIGHHANYTVTSNTVIDRTIKTEDPEYYVTTFLPTPKMPTYLVGWAVHDFVSETSLSTDNFKMWTRDSMRYRGHYALNRGQSIYSRLTEWMGAKNPIAKMDQVAVPDFNFNAMENWGMITYRESVVLFEDGASPTRAMVNGLTTMAHEYAHTWFGNLVTPKFWDVVWLKEGFASYFQYFALSLVAPDWRMMDTFVVDDVQPTLLADAVQHERTMNGRNVGSPESIAATLDFVSYRKGAAIIRMLNYVIGESTFQQGLRNYLKSMSFKAATPSDLYKHLQDALNAVNKSYIPIEVIGESWANWSGYPLVTVKRNYTANTLEVSQERFFLNRESHGERREEHKWWIPLNFARKSSATDFELTKPRYWLTPRDESKVIERIRRDDWVVFNVQQIGYYRVNYDETNWQMLTDHLLSDNFDTINTVNRAALVDDAFNLARAGYVDYSIPFNLSRYLTRETEYEPWVAAVNNFKFLQRALSNVPHVLELLQERVRQLLTPIYNTLGFAENSLDSIKRRMLREIILSASCSVNIHHCLRTSESLFGSWISAFNKTSENILQIVPADLKSFVYCVGIRSGDENVWHRVWQKFLDTDLHTEHELLLRALGCTRKPNLINKYLHSSISLDSIRKQYRIPIVNAVLNGNPENVEYVLEFLQTNLERIIGLRGHQYLNKILTAVANEITTDEQTLKLRLFAFDNIETLGPSWKVAVDVITSAAENVKWIKKYSPYIAKFLV